MPDERARERRELETQAHEHERQAAELRREANERLADTSRVKGEETRKTGETDRDTAEDERKAAEEGRVTAEDARVEESHQPIWVPRTKKSALFAMTACLLVGSIPGGFVSFLLADAQNNEGIEDQIGACERVTQDRIDNARAWTQAEETWLARAHDPKVASERRLAGATAVVYAESANQLRSRLFHCRPLIEDDQRIIDDRALREAQGEL